MAIDYVESCWIPGGLWSTWILDVKIHQNHCSLRFVDDSGIFPDTHQTWDLDSGKMFGMFLGFLDRKSMQHSSKLLKLHLFRVSRFQLYVFPKPGGVSRWFLHCRMKRPSPRGGEGMAQAQGESGWWFGWHVPGNPLAMVNRFREVWHSFGGSWTNQQFRETSSFLGGWVLQKLVASHSQNQWNFG